MKVPLVVHEYISTFPLFPYSTENKGIREMAEYDSLWLLREFLQNKGLTTHIYQSKIKIKKISNK